MDNRCASERIPLFFHSLKFKEINIHSHNPQQTQLPNYVSPEFEPFIDTTIEEWIDTGVLASWEEMKAKNNNNDKPTTVMP